jgi:hypothetical protein
MVILIITDTIIMIDVLMQRLAVKKHNLVQTLMARGVLFQDD